MVTKSVWRMTEGRCMKLRCSDDRDEHPLMTATRWIIIASFWMFGMVGAATAVMALAMGVL